MERTGCVYRAFIVRWQVTGKLKNIDGLMVCSFASPFFIHKIK
nr:MAG TPA: hypothetical protein [Caudoviricetes sp.]